ncbi:hypothetical protein BH18THE2_BH18THE2_03510 [soil metagenome]
MYAAFAAKNFYYTLRKLTKVQIEYCVNTISDSFFIDLSTI